MLKNGRTCVTKIWCTFSVKTKNGIKTVSISDLPMDRYEEYINFKMKYYVKYEITHKVSGIPDSKVAMDEYREILHTMYKDSSIKKTIVCVDDENESKIIGITAQKFTTINSVHVDTKARTAPVKNFYKILTAWNNLYPVPELMRKHNITSYYDDMGIAIHPLYSGIGLATRLGKIRRDICKADNVPMTGAWMTSLGSEKAAARDGWEIVYKIGNEELESILGVKFENPCPFYVYMIAKI